MEPEILPANDEAERSILGAILLSPIAYDEAVTVGLEIGDFSLSSHRTIFSIIAEQHEAGHDVDLVSICDVLRTRKKLESVGEAGYLSSLFDVVPDQPYRPATIRTHVRIVREKAKLRAIVHACNAASAQASEGTTPARECAAALGDTLLQVQADAPGDPAQHVAKFTDATIREWEKLADSDRDLIGLATGLEVLDSRTTGIRPGELWLVAGRTGDGKTALGLEMVAANCRENIPVGIFSFEMGKQDVLQRLWSQQSGVPFRQIRNPRNIPCELRQRVQKAACEIGQWPLFICDDGALTVAQLQAKARILVRREKVELLLVDYVQLVNAPARDERERITKVSNALRALAKDTGVPIVAISQLSRPRDGNPNMRPNRFALKESGSLENDAHVIVLIYRPMDSSGQYVGEDELILAKQRSGPVGIAPIAFLDTTLTFKPRYMGRSVGDGEYGA